MVDEAAIGLDRLRISVDTMPVHVPAGARALPNPLFLPGFASLTAGCRGMIQCLQDRTTSIWNLRRSKRLGVRPIDSLCRFANLAWVRRACPQSRRSLLIICTEGRKIQR
jgi:hypothetical protein